MQLFLKSKLTTPYKWNLFVVIFDWRKNQDNKPISVSSSSPYPISRKMSLLHIFWLFLKSSFFHSISNIWLTNALKFCTDRDVSNALSNFWDFLQEIECDDTSKIYCKWWYRDSTKYFSVDLLIRLDITLFLHQNIMN